MSDALQYLMRDAGPADVPFVVAGWVHEMRHSHWTRGVRDGVYVPAQHELVHRLVQGSAATVACDRDNPEHLMGCVVFRRAHPEPVIHWLYVKGAYRGLGLGRALLFSCFDTKPERILCTQASRVLDDAGLVARYNIVYSPYLLLGIALPSPANDAGAAEHKAG